MLLNLSFFDAMEVSYLVHKLVQCSFQSSLRISSSFICLQRWLITVVASAVVALVFGFIIGYLVRRAYHLRDKEQMYTTISPAVAPLPSQVCQPVFYSYAARSG